MEADVFNGCRAPAIETRLHLTVVCRGAGKVDLNAA